MPSFTIPNGASQGAKTVGNNDVGTIGAGGTLSAATAITWNGGSTSPGVVIENFGLITATGRGLNTGGGFTNGSLTFNNYAGAEILAADDALRINNSLAAGAVITVVNSGQIVSGSLDTEDQVVPGDSGQAIDFNAISSINAQVSITNNVGGLIAASGADAIRPGANATIQNYGTIIGLNAPGDDGANGVDFQQRAGGVLENEVGGVIEGGDHAVSGDVAAVITNGGVLTGHSGSGVNLDSAANTTSVITNSGTITGFGDGVVDGDGVDVDGLATITNSGVIEALEGETAERSEAITIGGGAIQNLASGVIRSVERAITIDNSDVGGAHAAATIVNAGLIQGDDGEAIVMIGGFADTIVNTGTIAGAVKTGAGSDSVLMSGAGVVTGVVEGEEGNDTLSGAAAGDTLSGGIGDDRLYGGAGDDRVTGGLGRDVHVVNADTAGADIFTDFALGADKLQLLGGARIAGVRYGDYNLDGVRDTQLILGGTAEGTITLWSVSTFNNVILF